jgi:hypothetical protein
MPQPPSAASVKRTLRLVERELDLEELRTEG